MDINDQRDYAEESANRTEIEREGMAELAEEQAERERATPRELPSVTQWACTCCALVMANGECCDSDQHGGDSREPLSEIPYGAHTTLGMDWSEHSEDCPNRKARHTALVECDCRRREFSRSSCDACGSSLAGERHAFVIWTPAASGKCPKCGSECYWANRTESNVDWFKCGNRDHGAHYTQEELMGT